MYVTYIHIMIETIRRMEFFAGPTYSLESAGGISKIIFSKY